MNRYGATYNHVLSLLVCASTLLALGSSPQLRQATAVQLCLRLPLISTLMGGAVPAGVTANYRGAAVDQQEGLIVVAGAASTPAAPGFVAVFDTMTGRLLRSVALRPAPNVVAVDSQTHRIFAVHASLTAEGVLTVLDERRLRVLASFHVGKNASAPLIDDGARHAFVGSVWPPVVQMFDAGTGRLLTTATGVALAQGILGRASMVLDPSVHRLFTVNSAGDVNALDSRTGTVTVRAHLPEYTDDIAVDATQGHVFISDYGPTTTMLDRDSLSLLKSVELPNGGSITTMIDQRVAHLFVSFLNDGRISMLDTRTNRVLSTIPVLTPDDVINGTWLSIDAVDERQGVIFVGVPARNPPVARHLVVLDGRTGAILRGYDVGGSWPITLAVDEQRNRAVIYDNTNHVLKLFNISCI